MSRGDGVNAGYISAEACFLPASVLQTASHAN